MINTFVGFNSGRFSKLSEIKFETSAEDSTIDPVKDVLKILIQPIEERYASFFDDYPPEDFEFIIAWADQHVLTNKRMIIFPSNDGKRASRSIRLNEIESYHTLGAVSSPPLI